VAGDRSRLLATATHLKDGRQLLVVVGTGTDVSDDAVDDFPRSYCLTPLNASAAAA
jgi:hypothetical protein